MSLHRVCWSLSFWLLTPLAGWSWSEDGHVIVCKIAEKYLSPEARIAIKELLDDRSISEPRISSWADLIRSSAEYRRKYPKHDTWHYINIELKTKKDEFRPPEDGNHVIGAIERFRKTVVNPVVTKEDRKEALMFLVHFIGDMHQPLHCGHRDDDRGGNLQPIKSFRGQAEDKLNLHKVWDVHLVKAVRGDLTNEDFVKRLIEEIRQEDREAWSKGDVATWVWEAHEIVVGRVYRYTDGTEFPKRDAAVPELTEGNYIKANQPIVREQIKKGGVRMAKVLNDCFDKPPVKPKP